MLRSPHLLPHQRLPLPTALRFPIGDTDAETDNREPSLYDGIGDGHGAGAHAQGFVLMLALKCRVCALINMPEIGALRQQHSQIAGRGVRARHAYTSLLSGLCVSASAGQSPSALPPHPGAGPAADVLATLLMDAKQDLDRVSISGNAMKACMHPQAPGMTSPPATAVAEAGIEQAAHADRLQMCRLTAYACACQLSVWGDAQVHWMLSLPASLFLGATVAGMSAAVALWPGAALVCDLASASHRMYAAQLGAYCAGFGAFCALLLRVVYRVCRWGRPSCHGRHSAAITGNTQMQSAGLHRPVC